MTISDRVLDVLVDVSEIEDVRHDPDVRLYDLQILDSMKTVRADRRVLVRVRRRDLACGTRPRGVGDAPQDRLLHGTQGRRLRIPRLPRASSALLLISMENRGESAYVLDSHLKYSRAGGGIGLISLQRQNT